MRSRTTSLLLILALFWIGFLLRLYGIARTPYRGDEAFSAQYWAGQPLADSLTHIATIEPHPILTYAIFRAWGQLAGTTELPLRMLPAFVNLLGIPAVYGIGRRLGGRSRTALLAAFLFAIHPYEIWHSQDARNYAIWAGLSALSLWLGLRAVKRPTGKRWIAYGIAAAVTINVFYFEGFMIAALGLSILLLEGTRTTLRWLLAVLPGVIIAVISFLVLQGQLISSGTYVGTTGTLFDPARFATWFLPSLVLGETIPPGLQTTVGVLMLPALVVGLALILRRDRRTGIRLAILALLPLTMLVVMTLRLNVFNARYVLPAVPLITMVGAITIGPWLGTSQRRFTRIMGVTGITLWTAMSLYSLTNYAFDSQYAKSQDWPELTAYLAEMASPKDVVIQLSVDPAFGYYYHGQADETALPARPNQPVSEIEATLSRLRQDHWGVWMVGRTFPYWPNTGSVERWLEENMQPVLRGDLNGLPYAFFLPWQVDNNERDNPTDASLGDTVVLEGTSFILSPGRKRDLTAWLYWRPIKPSDTPLKIFVHLEGPVNPTTGTSLWAQDDQFPQDGRVSTTDWNPGEAFRDIYKLDLSVIPAGEYSIRVGLYDPVTGSRLPTAQGDSANVARVMVNQEGRLDVRPSTSDN